jgi:hypothetical protein
MKNKPIITETDDIVSIINLKCGDMIEFMCDNLQSDIDFVKQPCYIHDYRPTTKELVFSSTYIIKTATVLGIKIHQPWVSDSASSSTILILLFTDIGTFNSYMSRDTNLTATVKLIKSYEQL